MIQVTECGYTIPLSGLSRNGACWKKDKKYNYTVTNEKIFIEAEDKTVHWDKELRALLEEYFTFQKDREGGEKTLNKQLKELYQNMELYGLTDERTIAKSQKIDKMIVKAQKLKYLKYKVFDSLCSIVVAAVIFGSLLLIALNVYR